MFALTGLNVKRRVNTLLNASKDFFWMLMLNAILTTANLDDIKPVLLLL